MENTGKGAQHIAALNFDLSEIEKQFRALEKSLLEESVKLSELWSNNFKLDANISGISDSLKEQLNEFNAVFSSGLETAEQQAGSSRDTIRRFLLDIGDTGAELTTAFLETKNFSGKHKFIWNEDLEGSLFESGAKQRLSHYFDFVEHGTPEAVSASGPDELPDLLANLGFPGWGDQIGHYTTAWTKLNEVVKEFHEEMNRGSRMGIDSYMEDYYGVDLEKQADWIARITAETKNLREVQSTVPAGDTFLSKEGLDEYVGGLEQAADKFERFSTSANKNLETGKESQQTIVEYSDELGRTYKETWQYTERMNEQLGYMEKGFERTNVSTNETAKATERLEKQYERIYESTRKRNEQMAKYYDTTGDEAKAASLRNSNAELEKIKTSQTVITKKSLEELKLSEEKSKKEKEQVDLAQNRQAVLNAIAKSERETHSVLTQIANTQKTIRQNDIDDSALSGRLEILRQQAEELKEQLRIKGKLNEEQLTSLDLVKQESANLAKQTQQLRYDSQGYSDDPHSGGIFSRGARWFGAYEMFRLIKQGGKEAYTTIKDVESALMEISRVLDLTVDDSNALRDSLFSVSDKMGRDFDESAEIMLRFAQSGYDVADGLKMTEQALLAMNTAELDAQNSTHSLVGILKQWGLESEDLITIIDRLNYTADTNAITTQDLVDGLLRSSSAAKNAGFSFDETVGALVALREASGRTGKEVGTALNSLMSFTRRQQSLDLFEGMGVEVYVDETKENLRPLLDIWGDLSALVKESGDETVDALSKMDGMSELLTDDIAKAVGMQEEYNELFAEGLSDMEKLELFSQSGTFRQNYWIALLENFERIQEVVDDMSEAEGHSMAENVRYMDTLEAQSKILITSLKELAVAAGDAGLVNLASHAMTAASGLANMSTAVLKFTGDVGGLEKVLLGIVGITAIVKRESMSKFLIDSATALEKKLSSLWESVKNGTLNFKDLFSEISSGSITLSGFIGGLGVAVTAITLVTAAVNAYQAAQERARTASIQAAEGVIEQQSNLKSLSAEYDNLISKTELTVDEENRLKNVNEEIIDLLGDRASQLKNLEEGTESYNEALIRTIELESEYAEAVLKEAERAAAEQLEVDAREGIYDAGNVGRGLFDTISYTGLMRDLIRPSLGDYELSDGFLGSTYVAPKDSDSLVNYYYDLIEARNELSKYDNEHQDAMVTESALWRDISASIIALEGAVEEYLPKQVAVLSMRYEEIQGAIESAESYETLKEHIYEATNATGAQREAIDSVLAILYPLNDAVVQTGEGFEETSDRLESWQLKLEATHGDVETLTNEIDLLESAMTALAEGQGLSLESTMALLDAFPELADTLEIVGDTAYFSTDALEHLRVQKLANQAASQALEVAELLASSGIDSVSNSAIVLADELARAEDAELQFALMTKLIEEATSNATVGVEGLAVAVAKLRLLLGAMEQPKFDTSGIVSTAPRSSGGGGGSRANRESQERTRALQEEQRVEQNAHRDWLERHKEKISAIDEEKKLVLDNIKENEKADKARYDKLKNQIKETHDLEIQRLNALKQEESSANQKADYEKERNELLQERAEEEKKTSRAAKERIREIDKALEELDEKESRRIFVEEIDKQIAKEKERYEEQIKNLDNEREEEKALYEEKIKHLTDYYDTEKKNLQALQKQEEDKWKERRRWYEDEIAEIRNTEQAAISGVSNVRATSVNAANEIAESNEKAALKTKDAWEEALKIIMELNKELVIGAGAVDATRIGLEGILDASDRRDRSPNRPRSGYIPGLPQYEQSHSGSVVTRDGLVDLQAGEIVVREDISRGLMQVTAFMDRFFGMGIHSPSGGASMGGDKAPVHLNFYAPLNNIEKQVFDNKRSADRNNREVSEMLNKALSEFPK